MTELGSKLDMVNAVWKIGLGSVLAEDDWEKDDRAVRAIHETELYLLSCSSASRQLSSLVAGQPRC